MAWMGGDAQRREGNGDELQEAHPTPLPGYTARPLLAPVTHMWKHPALRASQARDPKEINQNCSVLAKNHWDSGWCSSCSPGGRSARGCCALGWVCGRGTNPALFPPLQPPAGDEVSGPGIKPGFLGPGHRGRAGLGAQRGEHRHSNPPKPTQIFMKSSHPLGSPPAAGSILGRRKEEAKLGGKAEDGRRKEIRGRAVGRKSAVRTWPRFHHVPAALRKRRHGATEHLPHLPPGGDTAHGAPFSAAPGRNRGLGVCSPQRQSLGTSEVCMPKPTREKALEMTPKPNLMATWGHCQECQHSGEGRAWQCWECNPPGTFPALTPCPSKLISA